MQSQRREREIGAVAFVRCLCGDRFLVALVFLPLECSLEPALGRRDTDLGALISIIGAISASKTSMSTGTANTAANASTLKHARAIARHVNHLESRRRARGRKHAVNARRQHQRTGAAVLELERHAQHAADAHQAETNVRVVCAPGQFRREERKMIG
jgi:hypothetical protein